MKRIIGVVLVLLLMLPINIFAAGKVKVYVFEAGGCPFCEDQKEYLRGLEGYGSKFEMIVKELYKDHISWEEGKDYALGKKVSEAYNKLGFSSSYTSTPLVIISDIYAANTYSDSLESVIDQAYELGDKDIVGCIEKGNSNCVPETISNLDSDTSLRSIVVSVGELNPAFDKEKVEYRVEVRGNIEEVNINAECNGINCKVEGTGVKRIVEGDNEVVLKVIAENGDEQYYRVNVFREENYYKHLYIGVAGALVIIIVTLIGLIWSIKKNNKRK